MQSAKPGRRPGRSVHFLYMRMRGEGDDKAMRKIHPAGPLAMRLSHPV